MIIVSQDGRSIVNFEKVKIININRSDLREISAYFNCDEVKSNDNVLLGTYETEERSKEVLEEIIEAYNKSNEDFYVQESETRWEKGEEYLVGYKNKNTNKVYYMPLQ